MSDQPHECEAEDVCTGLIVTLDLDLIVPLCPHRDERTLRRLLEQHAGTIAACMIDAGVEAAARLFNDNGGLS